MRNYFLCVLFCSLVATAQEDKGIVYANSNWTTNWTNYKSKATNYRETTALLTGVIDKDLVLSKKDTYLLTGNVYVTNGATLTIEPGVVIRADVEMLSSLVITKGSKIIAKGTETDPIVFTSNKSDAERKAGDWGGLVLLGDAPTNKFLGSLAFIEDQKFNGYGGDNAASNSGTLEFVRIEFSGKKNRDGSINGLTLAGVGNKTSIKNVQVSFSATDGFSLYGGNLNLSNLISFRNKGNDFVFNEGVQSEFQNSLAIRNPFVFGNEKSRCLKVSSYDNPTSVDLNKGITKVTAKNLTFIVEDGATTQTSNEAMFVKENALLNVYNTVISGFDVALFLDDKIKPTNEYLSKIQMKSIYFNNGESLVKSNTFGFSEATQSFFEEARLLVERFAIKNTDFFVETDIKNGLDLQLKFNQKLATGVASNLSSK